MAGGYQPITISIEMERSQNPELQLMTALDNVLQYFIERDTDELAISLAVDWLQNAWCRRMVANSEKPGVTNIKYTPPSQPRE